MGMSRAAGVNFWCWRFLLGGMTLVTAAWFAYPLSHLLSPMSFNYSEGWNAYWDDAARMGRPLYAAQPDLSIVNYPPVSFHLVGLFSRIFGGVPIAGRILALFCLAWSALNVATAAATITRSRPTGVYASLCFLSWLALLTPGRIATNDPHFLALAFSTLGVCAYLRSDGRAGWIAAAAVFFTTSLFVKNSLLAGPLATVLHLLVTRQGRSFAFLAGAGALLGGLFLALTFLVDGPFFLTHLLAHRAFSRVVGFENLSAFYTIFYAPVLIGIGWLLWSRCAVTGFIALYCVCSALLAIGFGFGNGVAYNTHYETLVAMALAVAAAVSTVQQNVAIRPRGWSPVAAVALLAVAPVLVRTPGDLYGTLGRWARLPQRETDFTAALTVVKTTSGPALCESLLMCFEAGKSFVYDPYYVKDQVSIGRISEAQIIAALNARRYAAVQLGEDDASFTLGDGERLRFSTGVVSALLANYRVSQQSPYYAVLVPN